MCCHVIIWNDFFTQTLSNIIGGIVLAVIIYLLGDIIFKISNINGCWYFRTTTNKSTLNSYNKMVLTYKVLIWMAGKNIHGTGEKIKEKTIGNDEINYVGPVRTQIIISGYLTKRYLLKDKIIIHIKEKGTVRDSSSIQTLTFKKNNLIGKFISTAADSEGDVIWSKQV